MECEGHWAVKLAADLAHHVVLLENLDRVAEVVTKQHRRDGEEADHHGWDRQKYERHRDDSRTLVRLAAVTMVVFLPMSRRLRMGGRRGMRMIRMLGRVVCRDRRARAPRVRANAGIAPAHGTS